MAKPQMHGKVVRAERTDSGWSEDYGQTKNVMAEIKGAIGSKVGKKSNKSPFKK